MSRSARALTLFAPVLSLPRPGLLLRRWTAMRALARQRRHLAALDAVQLADLGLTPDQARAEAARPFWDAPRHWR